MTKSHYKVQYNFNDTISDLSFGNLQRYLACTSWEGLLVVFEFTPDYGQCTPKIEYKDTERNAYLRCCFNSDCSDVFFGTSFGEIKSISINSSSPFKPNLTYHHKTAPIIGLTFCEKKSLLVALAMDFKVLLIKNPVETIDIDCKPICMDISGTKLFIAGIGSIGPAIIQLDLESDKPRSIPLKTDLQYQIRSISVSKSKPDLYVVGSIFGQIEVVDGSNKTIIDVHREDNNGFVFASNGVAMVGNTPCAISAGGNGFIKMINIEKRRGGRELKFSNFPLTGVAVSSGGEVAAVSQGNDWSRGGETKPESKPEIALYIKKINQQEF